MEKLLKHLEFGEQEYEIQDILKYFTLPVVLKAKSQCSLSEKISVERGDVITIHGKRTVGVLKGKDCKGRTINLVTVCPYQVQVALPEEERIAFKSLKELCEKEGRPKFVEVKMDKENELDTVKNGDRLKVLLVEKGSNGPLFMHFRNEKGKHVRLPADLKASFIACPPDQKDYFISEIANINKAPLALFIQFIPCEETNIYSSLGNIEITEQSSIELLYITLKDGGRYYCCVNLSSIELSGQVPIGLVESSEEYKLIEKNIKELVNVEKFDAVVGSVDPLEWNPNFLLPFDKVFPKKKKDKAKKKDEDNRISALANDTDENLSDSASSESSKKKKRFTFFREDNGKAEKKENGRKEKKDKSKGKDGENSEKEQGSELENGTKNNKPGSEIVETECEILVEDSLSSVSVSEKSEEKQKKEKHKKTKEEKMKLKLQKEKEKREKKEEKKKKKKKVEKEKEQNDNLTVVNLPDNCSSVASAPSSPNCDLEDEYEMPINFRGTDVEGDAHEEKPKSKTLISRTWKKMKKRRRALSASNMQRSYSDASDAKSGKKDKGADAHVTDDEECPPIPLLVEPDYGDDIYEQIPGEFMSKDIYEEAIRAYGAYETAVSPEMAKRLSPQGETGDSGFDESDQKALDNFRESTVPPPLPGNHPKMQPAAAPRRGSSIKDNNLARSSVDSAGFRKFYESLKASEAELRSWGPEEIEKSLKDLQLGKYMDKFTESQIDGSLLIDLDEAVLRDLGLSLFEARKLRKFVFGWRPDESRAPNHYDSYDKRSKNPSYWDTPMVATIVVNELGMKDFGKFCAENQVNGDLLRDIVVDEELLKFLLAGKDMRLNAVKLKNFVLDGWRPQKKKSVVDAVSPYEEPVSVRPDEKDSASAYEEPVSPISSKTKKISLTYEEPVCLKSPAVITSNKSEPVSPIRLASDTKGQRKTSVETMTLVGSTGGVNSLMQKYEKKSNTIGISPGRGKKPTSPSAHTAGVNYRTKSDATFVTNMKKKFNDGN